MLILTNLKISIVSPQNILNWASRYILGVLYIGEIYFPETINYLTGTVIRGGLFCDKIFGPMTSWKCKCLNICKKYKHICFLCGYEVNTYETRKFRMGVIFFNTPIFHTWYFASRSSILPLVLNSSKDFLCQLIYYKYCRNIKNYKYYLKTNNIIFNKLYIKQLIYVNIFIQNYLHNFNILENIILIKEKLLITKNKFNLLLSYKKLLLLDLFFFNKLVLSWLLLDNFPVLPPDLRPIARINKNHFLISPINNLYKNILIHNNKLKMFINLKTKMPLPFQINEKIKLQESIDNILSKNKHYKNLNFILKSLSTKYGIFRQNLLGKRVDYSGRSVIVAGPDLNFSKIGIPLTIACNLFTSIIFNIIKNYRTIKYILYNLNYIYTTILYRRLITKIFKTNIVLINRAPTLHRVNIQGFKPYLIEGQSIKLYPLVCASFNADFDGDQMSILLMLTKPSRLEAKYILSSDKNFLSTSTGINLFKLTQTVLLGLFFINTLYYKKKEYLFFYFNSIEDLLNYCMVGLVTVQSLVWVKLKYININCNLEQNCFMFTSVSRIIFTKLITI